MTRVKKSTLRKGLPQKPINYPGPGREVEVNVAKERAAVERLAVRLADNEVEVRDAVLAELPGYIREKCLATAAGLRGIELPALDDATYVSDDALLAMLDDSDTGCAELTYLFDKLCLGLHYCLWHSDKPLVQLACADSIAALIQAPPTPLLRWLFVRSLFKALAKQWGTIDRYRMDKYLALVRRVACKCFEAVRDDEGGAQGVVIGAGVQKEAAQKKLAKKGGPAAVPAAAAAAALKDDGVLPARGSFSSSSARMCALLFQREVIRGDAPGFALHTADVVLNELMRPIRPAPLRRGTFVTLFTHVALFAMSRGDFVEKRIMDHCVVPLASGVLAAAAGHGPEYDAAVVPAVAAEAQRLATAKGTKFGMRALLTESQRLLEDYASTLDVDGEDEDAAAAIEQDTPQQLRKRIAAEVKRVEASKVASYGVMIDARESRERRTMMSKDANRGARKKQKSTTGGGKPQKSRHSKRWK